MNIKKVYSQLASIKNQNDNRASDRVCINSPRNNFEKFPALQLWREKKIIFVITL